MHLSVPWDSHEVVMGPRRARSPPYVSLRERPLQSLMSAAHPHLRVEQLDMRRAELRNVGRTMDGRARDEHVARALVPMIARLAVTHPVR